MRSIPIREFQQRGARAITKGAAGPFLVTGRPGPLFILVPVDAEHLAEQEREITRAMARADLRGWQARAVAAGLDQLGDAEIEAEIAASRAARRAAAAKPAAAVKPVAAKRAGAVKRAGVVKPSGATRVGTRPAAKRTAR